MIKYVVEVGIREYEFTTSEEAMMFAIMSKTSFKESDFCKEEPVRINLIKEDK